MSRTIAFRGTGASEVLPIPCSSAIAAAALLVALVVGFDGSVARAQDLPPATSLQQLADQNDAMKDMAGSIDSVCPTLVRDAPGTDLQEICTAMVQTANDILNQEDDGSRPDGDSLGLTTGETNNALQSINGEELQNPAQQITEIRDTMVGALTARVDAIRAGTVGPGISVAGLGVGDGDRVLAADEMTDQVIIPAQWSEHPIFSRVGLFANGKVIIGNKDKTDQSDGFDFHSTGITVGADYRVTNDFVLGTAFGFSRYKADIDNTPRSPNGQDLDSNTYALSMFGTYSLDFGLFFDAIGTVGWGNFDSERSIFIPDNTGALGGDIDRNAKGDFDTLQYGLSVRVGYDWTPEQAPGLTVTPLAGVEVLRAKIDDFKENGAVGLNLEYDDYTAKSTVSNLGVEANYAISTDFGVITPSVHGRWVHEFENNNGPDVRYSADNVTQGDLSAFQIEADSTDNDYGVVGAGLVGQFAAGWSAFADYSTPVGLDDFTVHQVFFGFRKDF